MPTATLAPLAPPCGRLLGWVALGDMLSVERRTPAGWVTRRMETVLLSASAGESGLRSDVQWGWVEGLLARASGGCQADLRPCSCERRAVLSSSVRSGQARVMRLLGADSLVLTARILELSFACCFLRGLVAGLA
mmetsp:Transcript_41486/g.90319  ORF Transcript_41486/g.90319 Transcript_41486/m.90319 type:complete len:135 (-) Transcript_41486:126-530(-)